MLRSTFMIRIKLMTVGSLVTDKSVDFVVCACDVVMPRFSIEPKERIRAIVNNFNKRTVSMKPNVTTQGKIVHGAVVVKIFNHVVEV